MFDGGFLKIWRVEGKSVGIYEKFLKNFLTNTKEYGKIILRPNNIIICIKRYTLGKVYSFPSYKNLFADYFYVGVAAKGKGAL